MKYELLGPIRVVGAREAHSVSAPKMEMLLAALLVNADQVLTVEQLYTEIWQGGAPRRALATLQVYISQLRRFLRAAGHPGNPIVKWHSGYLLAIGADQLDLRVFTRLMRQGRGHARAARHEAAKASYEAALSLQRGPVAGDLSCGPIVNQLRAWFAEALVECNEALVDAELALGCHRETVGRLYCLTVEHPYNETFYAQLMRALSHCGRRADALKVFHSASSRLMADLGVEPSRALREIHDSILVAPRDDRYQVHRPAAPRSAHARRAAPGRPVPDDDSGAANRHRGLAHPS